MMFAIQNGYDILVVASPSFQTITVPQSCPHHGYNFQHEKDVRKPLPALISTHGGLKIIQLGSLYPILSLTATGDREKSGVVYSISVCCAHILDVLLCYHYCDEYQDLGVWKLGSGQQYRDQVRKNLKC